MSAARKLQNQGLPKSPQLRIIFGGLHTGKKQKRINDFWVFCHSTFWSRENFTESQQEDFKHLIAEHFRRGTDVDTTFRELIQRAILAKRYVRRGPGRYMPKPADWLNVHFARGLSGTASWYSELAEQRKTVPSYN